MTIFYKVEILAILILLIDLSVQVNSKEKQCRDDLKRPIVRIPSLGCLRGSVVTTKWTNREFYQFLGVKYAESPSGSRRFKVKLRRNIKKNSRILRKEK